MMLNSENNVSLAPLAPYEPLICHQPCACLWPIDRLELPPTSCGFNRQPSASEYVITKDLPPDSEQHLVCPQCPEGLLAQAAIDPGLHRFGHE